MAKAVIEPGICGFMTTVEVQAEDSRRCRVVVESECKHIQKLAAALQAVDPFTEISFRKGLPVIFQEAAKYCAHAACPVPVGIVKAVEVAAGLALPKDVVIRLEK